VGVGQPGGALIVEVSQRAAAKLAGRRHPNRNSGREGRAGRYGNLGGCSLANQSNAVAWRHCSNGGAGRLAEVGCAAIARRHRLINAGQEALEALSATYD
jgi:hypothetical protein